MPENNDTTKLFEQKLALAEYQLFERVEKRVIEKVQSLGKYIGIALLTGLTLFGLVGVPAGFNYVSERVIQRVSEQIDKETMRLRDRLHSDLAEIAIKKAEIASGAEDARLELERFRGGTKELRKMLADYAALRNQVASYSLKLETVSSEMSSRATRLEKDANQMKKLAEQYEDLQASVASLNKNVGTAVGISAGLQLQTESLGLSLTSSSLGLPAIFRVDDGVFGIRGLTAGEPLEIQGVGFGNSVGKLSIRTCLYADHLSGGIWDTRSLAASLTGPTCSDQVEVERQLIAEWKDTSVRFSPVAPLLQKLKTVSAEKGIGTKQVNDSLSSASRQQPLIQYEYRVENSSGEKSGWFASFATRLIH